MVDFTVCFLLVILFTAAESCRVTDTGNGHYQPLNQGFTAPANYGTAGP